LGYFFTVFLSKVITLTGWYELCPLSVMRRLTGSSRNHDWTESARRTWSGPMEDINYIKALLHKRVFATWILFSSKMQKSKSSLTCSFLVNYCKFFWNVFSNATCKRYFLHCLWCRFIHRWIVKCSCIQVCKMNNFTSN
jgi:hypothetical protein